MRKLLVLFLILTACVAFGQEPVPPSFFGMHAHLLVAVRKQPWPSAPFGALRLWDSSTKWFEIEPQPGNYKWWILDQWLDLAQEHHVDVVYTFGGIPTWASKAANDAKCNQWNMPGSCHPPTDLAEDGSGSNQMWKDFVTAVAKHAHGRIKYWEVWNEPHNLFFWHGSMAQIVRMTQDMRDIVKGIDPDAVIVSPGTGWQNMIPQNGKPDWNPLIWTDQYLAAGGKKYIDVLGIHGYLHGQCPSGAYDVNQIEVRLADVHKIMQKNGIPDMPIWSTEGSWGNINKFCTTDTDMQIAFVGQYHITAWAAGIRRAYWYAWNDHLTGVLWDENGPRPAAKAYGEVYHWMVGSTFNSCDKSKNQTSCSFSRPDGSQYLAIWDASQTCSSGQCNTRQVKVDPQYVDYLDLDGGKNKIQNNTVPVGMKPIWLEAPAGSKRR